MSTVSKGRLRASGHSGHSLAAPDMVPPISELAAWLAKNGPISVAINAFGMQVRAPFPTCALSAPVSSVRPLLTLSLPSSTAMASPSPCGRSAALGSSTTQCCSWATATVSPFPSAPLGPCGQASGEGRGTFWRN